MREILFRGKRIDNGEWVYGFYVPVNYAKPLIVTSADIDDYSEIEFDDYYHVNDTTVGQYTGLTDKNGKKIFEGDIVDCLDYLGEVYYDPDGCYDLRDNTGEMRGDFIGTCHSREVIGNIHDNPELLEVGE